MESKKINAGLVFDVFNITFMLILCVLCIYPFLYIFNLSISEGTSASQYGLNIMPNSVTLKYYKQLFATNAILTGFKNSIFRTVVGTCLAVFTTAFAAYPLSKKYLPNRCMWTVIVTIPMFFSGGLIPSYLIIRSLHLLDTPWVLILPSLVSSYNLLLVRNYMMSLPDSIEESAKIDGANDLVILWRIILPLCKPILATVALWVAVGHWNAWFDCLIYITKQKLIVLQVVLYQVINMGKDRVVTGTVSDDANYPEILKACTIMVTTLPIILVYPFLQKYFIQGVMVGSVKG